MSWTFDNNKPIYLQIMDKIKLQIISHKLEPSQQIQTPSNVPYQTWKEKASYTASGLLAALSQRTWT